VFTVSDETRINQDRIDGRRTITVILISELTRRWSRSDKFSTRYYISYYCLLHRFIALSIHIPYQLYYIV